MKHCSQLPGSSPEHGGSLDPVTTRAFQAFGRAIHLHRQAMQRRFSDPATHHADVFSLRLLAQHDGMSQSEVADTLHLSRPRVTSILQGLEKAGAIRREVDPDDQRITRVFLTEEGRRREIEYRAAFEDYLDMTIGALSDSDKEELARILDEVSAHIAGLLGSGGREQEGQVVS